MKKLVILPFLVFILFAATVFAAAKKDGLAGFWSFEGNKKDNLTKDQSGRNNDAVVYGVSDVKGVIGRALKFDGVNDLVEVGDPGVSDFDLAGNLTVALWVNPESSQKLFADILRKEDSIQNNGYGLEANGANNTYSFGWKGPFGWQCWNKKTFNLTPNVWQHLVIVKKGAVRDVFINGQEVAGAHCVGTNSVIQLNNAPLQIGGWTLYPARHWNGKMDELRIYDRALAVNEIVKLQKIGSGD